MAIYDLKINHLRNPLGIGTDFLSYSFKSDEKGPFTATVADAKKRIMGKAEIESINSVAFQIECKLKKASEYSYTVTSADGRSASMTFETADTLDAKVITCADKDIESPVFTKSFTVSGKPVKARLTITGLGVYEAEINGRKAGNAHLAPGFNDYDAYVRYQTYDVTDLMKPESVISVSLGNGWYKGRIGFGENQKNRYGDAYELCAKLSIYYADGKTEVISTDETWTYTDSACTMSDIYDGETRDYTKKISKPANAVISKKKLKLIPDFGTQIVEKHALKPTLVISPANEQILDFGQNMVGFVRFSGKFAKGTVITLKHGEVLQKGCFYNTNYRSAKATAQYVSDGKERTYEPHFTFFGFRYVRVEGIEKVNPDDFEGIVIYSDLEETCSCVTDNAKINQLFHNSLWGQKGNFVDVPTDCPQRDERLGWTGDTQVFSRTACFQMDSYNFYRKNMTDLRADQTMYYDGDLPCFTPSLKHSCRNGGSVWADTGTIVPWNVYMAYGDKELLRKNYDMMKDYTECLIRKDEKQGGKNIVLMGATYGDWLALDGADEQCVWGGTDYTYINAMYYFYSVTITAKAAKELGNAEDYSRYSKKAEKIKKAIVSEFFTGTGRLCVNTQTAYILALTFGVYKNKEKTLDEFNKRLRKDNFTLKTGFTGSPLFLPCLFDNGLDNVAYDILCRESFPGWLYAVNLGATTIWERWNSLLEDGSISGTGMNSLNHYSYGSVCESVYSYIAGLKNAAPGWKKAVIEPHPYYKMKRIAFAFNSPSGIYYVKWNVTENDEFVLDVEIPAGCRATVKLPFGGGTHAAGPGKHSYIVENCRKLNYPFDLDTPLIDIINHKEADEVLASCFPGTRRNIIETHEYYDHTNQLFFDKGIAPEKVNAYLEKLRKIKA